MRSFVASLVLFLLGAVCGVGVTWLKSGSDASKARLEAVLELRNEENDRLRTIVAGQERARDLEKGKAQREEIEKQVTAIRGLPFKQPVEYAVVTRKQIQKVVATKLAEMFSEQEFANISAALARLGLLPQGYPLRQRYIDLLGEQIAAFYDQHQHQLFMFEDASLENAQNRVILAHELTHALQDQHFNLLHLPLEIKDNDDRAVAASALVEGEATIVMSDYMMRNMSLRALKDNVSSAFTQNMDQLQKAPRYLREELVFPYLRGQAFCEALIEHGGYDEISRAFAHPPSSTSQILHPQKYLAEPREDPIVIGWPDTACGGQKPDVDNVLGELGIRIQLADAVDGQTAESVAAGWRGDRYLSFHSGESLLWKTKWATDTAAAKFFEAELQELEKRYHPAPPHASGMDRYATDAPRALRLARVAGNSVVLIDAASVDAAKRMEEKFAH
jgi:hypothetical protein